MAITLVIITGFQVYWLKNNYDREKRTMQIKSNVAFQEAVRYLQALKMKLRDPEGYDSTHKRKMRVFIDEDIQDKDLPMNIRPRREIATMVNAMRGKLKDSLKDKNVNSELVISMNKDNQNHSEDSASSTFTRKIQGDSAIIRILYGVDSLQDSLRITEINAEYQKKLKEELLAIPFKIIRLNKVVDNEELDFSDVTVGFAHPVTYHLELGNTLPYLLRRITLPILFSIFLVGVTILSFLLLYRTLLKQHRLAELKNEFIGNITHELKTPIATVSVAIEALKNFNAIQDPQRTKEYLDISANELQRLSLLVDKVLKLSMFEKRELELKKEHFDMKDLISEVVNIMKLQFEKYGAQVNIRTEGTNFMIEADRLHITSVLYNLLDNALKYSGEDPSIEIVLSELPRDIIELKIKDNGIGIPKEYLGKIFEKFFRVPTGNRHNTKGYGLGLSYVSEIIKRHIGFIEVESEMGKGTTFTIKLPRREINIVQFDDNRRISKEARKLGSAKG